MSDDFSFILDVLWEVMGVKAFYIYYWKSRSYLMRLNGHVIQPLRVASCLVGIEIYMN